MSVTIPPADTVARKAMTDQGSPFYPGVDKWEHPKTGLKKGAMLVQFDHRDAEAIKAGVTTASFYFTDEQTVMKFLNEKDEIRAQGLAEALQVGPFRPNPKSTHQYSQNVTVYLLQRDLRAEEIQIAQRAEFGEGHTRNNLHWGDGVAKQYFIDIPKDKVLVGDNALLKVAGVIPCTDRDHRYDWLKQLELTKQPDEAVAAVIANVFEKKVAELLKGTLQQQQHGQEIGKLLSVRRSFDAPVMLPPSLQNIPKPPLSSTEPKSSPAPKPRRRGPHF